jgi:hypothetical protein
MEETTVARKYRIFTVPPKLRVDGIEKIGVRELTADEEKMAVRRVGGDSIAIAYELPKQALCEVNGKKVSLADGSTDKIWEQFSPQLRQLVLRAYAKSNNADDKDVDDFLESESIVVG